MRPPTLVTFAIATHNRGPVLLDCLRETLANGLAPAQFEIILIDNASTDGTAELINREYPRSSRFNLVRLNRNCGPVAKNIAIRKARGEFIVLLDDDAFPHPGAVAQMIQHFRDDKNLAGAVFDVTLPDGSKDAAAYPDVFIGAGTGLRRSALEELPGGGLLPAHFFMQAEEYDLSFRLLEAGFSIQRFPDLPLTHLKTPNARIGQRTTALDVRNNLYLLARYVPDPLAKQLAADWLSRYWMMAEVRDETVESVPHPIFGTHRKAFIRGSSEGLRNWDSQRAGGRRLLSAPTIERIFKFQQIRERLADAQTRSGARRILFAELGKNMLAYWLAARELGLEVRAIVDDRLAGFDSGEKPRDYRGIPLVASGSVGQEGAGGGPGVGELYAGVDLIVMSNMSGVQAPSRAAELRRKVAVPVVDLFSRPD